MYIYNSTLWCYYCAVAALSERPVKGILFLFMVDWYEVGVVLWAVERGERWGYLCMYILIKISNMGLYICL
jgi:hypothetical protein